MVSEAQLKTAVQEAGLENFLIVGPKALRRARGFVKSSKGARARLRKRRLAAAQQARIRRAQVERRREQTGLAEARAQEIGGLAGQLRSLQEIRLGQLEAKAQPSRIARRSVIVRGGREETFRSPEREAIRGKIRETGEEKIAFGNLVSQADRARIRAEARRKAEAEAAKIKAERVVLREEKQRNIPRIEVLNTKDDLSGQGLVVLPRPISRLSAGERIKQNIRLSREAGEITGIEAKDFRQQQKQAFKTAVRFGGEPEKQELLSLARSTGISVNPLVTKTKDIKTPLLSSPEGEVEEKQVVTQLFGVGKVPPFKGGDRFLIGPTGSPFLVPAFAPVASGQANQAAFDFITGRTREEQRGFRKARGELAERKEFLNSLGNLDNPSQIDLLKEGFQSTAVRLDIKAREAAINFGSFGIAGKKEVREGIGPATAFTSGFTIQSLRKFVPKNFKLAADLALSGTLGTVIVAQERQAVKELESVGLSRAEAVSARAGAFGANLPFFISGSGTSDSFLNVKGKGFSFSPVREFKTQIRKFQQSQQIPKVSRAGALELQARTSKIPFEDVAPARFNVERVVGGKRVSGKQTLLVEDKPPSILRDISQLNQKQKQVLNKKLLAIEDSIGLRPKRFKAAEEKLINQEVADIGGQAELLKAAESPFQTTVTGKPKPSNLEARFFTGRADRTLGLGPEVVPGAKKQPASQTRLTSRDILGFTSFGKEKLSFAGGLLVTRAERQASGVISAIQKNVADKGGVSVREGRSLFLFLPKTEKANIPFSRFFRSKRGSLGRGSLISQGETILEPKGTTRLISEPPIRKFRSGIPEFDKFSFSKPKIKSRLSFKPITPLNIVGNKLNPISVRKVKTTSISKPKIITDQIIKTDVKLIPDTVTVSIPKFDTKQVPGTPIIPRPKPPKTPSPFIFKPGFSPKFTPVPFPKFAVPRGFGGFGGGGRARVGKAGKQKKGFTPTFLALATGTRGASTFRGVKTGLGLRPIPKDFKIKIARLI